MTREKFFAKSLTMWGAVVAFLPGFLTVIGVGVPPELPDIADGVIDFANALNEIAGLVMIVWGRWRASSTLSLRGS